MAYKSDILLGRITKVNSYKGVVTVKLKKTFSENLPKMESVFLEIEGRLVPFFLSFSEYSGASIIKLQFEGYDSVLKVNEFIGCNVFLTTGTSEDYQSDDVQSLIGYNVLMQDNKLLGSIIEVKPNHGQWLLNIISTKNNDVLVPFHEHFIVSIDEKKKIIVMDIPEGLIEIN